LEVLNRYLQGGGKLESFSMAMLPEVLPPQDLALFPDQGLVRAAGVSLLRRGDWVSAFQSALASEKSVSLSDLRQRFEFLDDCVERSWLITTEQVSAILQLKPSSINHRAQTSAGQDKSSFRWHSWIFTRVGREGRESLWQVSSSKDVIKKKKS
jgi:hypothetical protein